MKLVTYNMNGGWWDVVRHLAEERAQYIGLQETHMTSSSGNPGIQGYKVFRSEDALEPKRGVMLLIANSVGGQQYEYRRRTGSEVWVSSTGFPFSRVRPGLIGVIHLHPGAVNEVDAICRFVGSARETYDIVLMGDVNSRLPEGVARMESFDGGVGSDTISRLTRAVHGTVPMYKGGSGSHLCLGHLTAIDVVIVSRGLRTRNTTAAVRLDLFGSDHYPVEVQGQVQVGGIEELPEGRTGGGQLQRVVHQLGRRWQNRRSVLSVDVMCADVNQCRQQGPKGHQKGRCIQTTETRRLRRQMEAAVLHSQHVISAETFQLARGVRKSLRDECWKDKIKWWESHLERLAELGKSDTRTYFRESKRLGGMLEPRLAVLKLESPSGEVLVGAGAEEELTAHFKRILSPRVEHDAEFAAGMLMKQLMIQHSTVEEEHWQFALLDFTEDEVAEAMSKQPRYTATGPDEIPAELWKVLWAEQDTRQYILEALNDVLVTGVFPTSWRESGLMPLKKKPVPKVVKDYRGIAITNCVYRLFMRIIQQRVMCGLETQGSLCGSQYGFRSGRSTVDAITALLEIVSRRQQRPKGKTTYALFIDYATAYDSISMDTLRTALMTHHIPQRLVDLIVTGYEYTDVEIKYPSGASGSFRGTCGLRQGCTCSPLMFVLIIDLLIRKLGTKPGIYVPGVTDELLQQHNGGLPLNNLFFADDGAIFASSPRILQDLTDTVVQWSKEWGLQINPSKCVAMKFSVERKASNFRLMVGQTKVPVAEGFMYLGCWVDHKCSMKQIALKRLEKVSDKVGMLQALCSKLAHARREVRQRVAAAIVNGTILYASEVWLWEGAEEDAYKVVSNVAQCVAGVRRSPNAVNTMLEIGWLDPVVTTISKRLAWTKRVEKGTASPTKVLWETGLPGSTVMGKIKRQTEAVQQDTGIELFTSKGEKTKVMRAWGVQHLKVGHHTSEATRHYVEEFYDTPGRRVQDVVKAERKAVRALMQFRTDSFAWWPRRRHWMHVGLNMGCLCCGSDVPETCSHVLLECPEWTTEREEMLRGEIGLPADKDKQVSWLLGRRSCEEDWAVLVWMKVSAFLQGVVGKREAKIASVEREATRS